MRPIEWRNHVQDWSRSGLTKRAYARTHSLSYSQLLYWTNKPVLADSHAEKLIPVKVAAESPKPDSLGIAEFPNGARFIFTTQGH